MLREKEIQAANRIEELIIIAKEMVIRIRNGDEPDAYAAVYWLRRELGYVVASLGVGVPATGIGIVETYYKKELN